MSDKNNKDFSNVNIPVNNKTGINKHDSLDINHDISHSDDMNFDKVSLTDGMSPFLKSENNDWKLPDINTSNVNANLSDFSITPLINEHTLSNEHLEPIGKPISDKNMIVEEPSPENEPKIDQSNNININNTPLEVVKKYNKSIGSNSEDLRTEVLKKMRKSNENSMKKPRPAFINKVWLMVCDETTDDCISWAHDGQSFIITHQIDFVTKVLPKYFKHCKIASFIRQLNMYGWKKVQDARSGGLNDPNEEKLQFYNENFIRGRSDLLDFINRQKSHNQTQNSSMKNFNDFSGDNNMNTDNKNIENSKNTHANNSINSTGLSWKMPQYIPLSKNNIGHMNLIEAPKQDKDTTNNNAVAVMHPTNNISKKHLNGLDTSSLLQEFETLKFNQLSMADDLKRLANQNDVLWKQNISTRKRLQKQENALQQILKFMSNYFGPSVQRLIQPDLGTNVDADIQNETNDKSNKTMKKPKRNQSSTKIVNLDEPLSKNKNRKNSTSRQINTGNGTTAQIQEILDDALVDPPNDNNDMNDHIVDELSPAGSSAINTNKNEMNSPMVQSVNSNKSPESIHEILINNDDNNVSGNDNYKRLAATPKFDLDSKHTPLSDSNVYKPYTNNSNIPISRDKYEIPDVPGLYNDHSNNSSNTNLNMLNDHNNYTDILSNLQENIKKQEEHLNGFSQILNKLQTNEETNEGENHNLHMGIDSPLISSFDLNDYLSTTPNTPSLFNANKSIQSAVDKPIVEEIPDSVESGKNKRKVAVVDLDDDESGNNKKMKKD